MGNYSNFSLTIKCDEKKHNPKDIIAHLRKDYEEAEYALDENGATENEAKWYDFPENMKAFSKKYPDVLFVFDIVALGAEDMIGDEFTDEDGNLCLDMKFQNGEELY